MERKRILCPQCESSRALAPHEVTDLLRERGKLRREAEPAPTLVEELLAAELPAMICPNCGVEGLIIDTSIDDGDDWEQWDTAAKPCEVCKEPLPPERLEIFPDSIRCAACQDVLATPEETDYCPRCGDLLTIRTSSRGVTRYQAYCPSCKR